VFDLATDRRTRRAYAQAASRAAVDPWVGLPAARGPEADTVVGLLARRETVRWLSWAYELREGQTGWWLVVLTRKRLIGVSSGLAVQSWSVPTRDWRSDRTQDDVVLHLGSGPPLRLRGSMAAHALFAGRGRPPVTVPAVAPTDVTSSGSDAAAARPTRRPRRPRKRRVRKKWVGFAPPATVWDLADRCVKCGRPLTDPRSRQARVGTKCIQVYGSQSRRIPNPLHADWVRRKNAAEAAHRARTRKAEADFARARADYEAAREAWRRTRHGG